MIKILIKKEENKIKQVLMEGHAMYDDYGRDIVCAGVSSILTTTVNAILLFDENAVSFEDKKNFILKVQKEDEITLKLIQNMISLFYELAKTYPKNITIREDE